MNILKSMHIFKQVAESQSFSKAAEHLNLVPSAVSRQISELESWMGVRLINRTTRTLHLTDDGREYLAKMSEILHQVSALQSLQEREGTLSGSVSISAPVMIGQHDIPQIISQFKMKYPDVKIALTLMNRKVDLIEEGYDFAIRAGYLDDSNFYARKISNTSFKTVISPQYLETMPFINTPNDLREHNCLINTASRTPKRWSYSVNGKTKSIKIEGDLETNDATCILSYARSGLGVALLPDLYVDSDLLSGDLVEVLHDYTPEPLPINIVYPSNKHMSTTLRTLIDFLAQSFK